MGRSGICKFNDLKKFQENLAQIQESQINSFLKSCAKELAARLLAKIIKRTPVGKYPKRSGKKGGTLIRGWTAGNNQAATAYAQSLQVHQFGGTYVIEIENPTEYASYVEFGHRTKNHQGWVEGKFMLTISEQEIETAAPAILERKLRKLLGECFK